ncbi:hypothetical protein DL96DRAFT_1647557 [Flagelloscypha sp. PMI_526]|nr:hypothetical protein DL96DRAFT_1647557 [Flagelloscypha sp. PMI_526]
MHELSCQLNNIARMVSLMNFVLTYISNNLDSSQEWFDIHTLEIILGQAKSTSIIFALHTILGSFLYVASRRTL